MKAQVVLGSMGWRPGSIKWRLRIPWLPLSDKGLMVLQPRYEVQAPGATPMRTPRDNFAINADGDMQLVGATPRDIKLRDMAMKHQLKQGLASLPKPKDTEWELELPEEQQELIGTEELSEEDAELRDRRNREIREAQELLESKRRTQVLQRGLPRPAIVDINKLLKDVSETV